MGTGTASTRSQSPLFLTHSTVPQLAIQAAIADGLDHVALANVRGFFQVGARAGDPQDAIVGSSRQPQVLHCLFEKLAPLVVEGAEFPQLSAGHVTVQART